MNNKADLVIRNVHVYNTYFHDFKDADVYVKGGKFLYIDRKKENLLEAASEIDGKGRYMIPGLIDIHMHIESSLVTPEAFSKYTVARGITTVVSEPHEIANVCGIDGIKAMIDSGNKGLYDIYYAIPSNVPIMGPEFETAGATITCEDMMELKDTDKVWCLGEVMNYKEIIGNDDSEVGKFIRQIHDKEPNYILEGHCPQLKDLDLAKFLYLGINSDHCEHDLEELKQRFENGMFVQIQGYMVTKENIDFIIANNLYDYFSFVTDDVFPDILLNNGHLDHLIREAIKLGMKPEWAIYSSTFTPANRMNMRDRGAIVPGRLADFLLIDDPNSFNIEETYKKGLKVYDVNEYQESSATYSLGAEFEDTIRIKTPDLAKFKVEIGGPDREVNVRVIDINRISNMTTTEFVRMPVRNNELIWQDSGCVLTMVLERHGKNGSIAYGFAKGDCLKKGAVCSSLSHDSHNIIVQGNNIEDMHKALDLVIANHGGVAAVLNSEVKGFLSLPIAGLMSNKSVEKTARQFIEVRKAFENQGYVHRNTIMNFALIALTCIPKIRLTDQGYMDTENLKMVPLYEEIEC